MSAALSTLTTHVQIGSLCVERHLFADIKLGTIDVLQTEVELVICRPLTDQEIRDVCFAQDIAKGRKQSMACSSQLPGQCSRYKKLHLTVNYRSCRK